MSKGWISLHRQFQDNHLWKQSRVFSKAEAWIDILLNVNHSENKVIIKGTLLIVKRGESIMSLETWSKRWKWNKSKVRRFFKLLSEDKMIEVKNERLTTRLTVCKYDSYQGERNADETQMKRKRNADETQMTPNNNDNNVNNENNENNVIYREAEFKNSLQKFIGVYENNMLNDFFLYWTEKKPKGKKMKFEMQRTFDIERRLARWNKNNFNNKNNKNENRITNEIEAAIRNANPNI